MRRKTIEDCKKIAKEREGRCLAIEYKNSKTKLKWECNDGHIFFATFNDICYKRSWCSECRNIKSALRIEAYNKRKKNEIINKIERIAENNDGRLLSDKNDYQNALGKLLWECQNEHQFWSSWLQVGIMGQWCPHCYAKTQSKIHKILKDEIFRGQKIKQNYRGFDWLVSPKGARLEVDIWIPSLKLAIEYDGEQHFNPTKFFAPMSDQEAEENLKLVQLHDQIKNNSIKNHPEHVKYFLRIGYKDRKKINRDFLIKKISRIGVKI